MMEKFSPPFLLLLLAVVGIILSLAGCQSAAGCGGVASFADMTVVRGVDYLPVAIGSRSAGRDITEADLGPAFDSITVSLGCSPPAEAELLDTLECWYQALCSQGLPPFVPTGSQAGTGYSPPRSSEEPSCYERW